MLENLAGFGSSAHPRITFIGKGKKTFPSQRYKKTDFHVFDRIRENMLRGLFLSLIVFTTLMDRVLCSPVPNALFIRLQRSQSVVSKIKPCNMQKKPRPSSIIASRYNNHGSLVAVKFAGIPKMSKITGAHNAVTYNNKSTEHA